MEAIYKGRKIEIEIRPSGTKWLIETTIWAASSKDAVVLHTIWSIGAPGQSEDAQKTALEAAQKLIDEDDPSCSVRL